MKSDWEYYLCQRVAALGNKPTESQIESLRSWISENVPADCLFIAAEEVLFIPDLYTDLRMRMGELGQ